MAGTSKQTDSSCFPSSSSFQFWDVFLSFGGKDTRKSFIGNLYSALDQTGIRTFKDEPGLERGEEIAPQLIKAIHESKMSIVVFSKNYASSKWCLNELAEILECERTRGQIVLPVFYDVDPLNVRHQTESYAEAFEKHKIRYGEKVETWRTSLTTAANISGYDLKNDANGHEADLILKIVNDVQMKLCPKYLNVTEHQVGIDSRVKRISQKLSIGSNDVRFIGIYGMAGIGKTTIVKTLYNKIYREFEGSCFLENVREAFEKSRGLLCLLEQLIFQLLKKDFKIPSVDAGISFVKQRLRSKKVLIVLDDLDEIKQLVSLAGNWNWFGPGSRIIVTTRDSRILDEFQVDVRHEVEELNNNESLELFERHAFRNTTPMKKLMELSEDIVKYVGGLPLALEVLGSSLFDRPMVQWESVFGKLKKIPHNHIQKKLRISYDALGDDKVRDIFLDIAFFFIGMDKDDAIKILDACGFFPEIGISNLRERCLLKIDWSNILHMHNLIRDMGRKIVHEESVKNPRKRSRLFDEDAYDVLKKSEGHENIEGIRLVMPMQEEVDISTRAFHSLPNLRLLQISNVNLAGSFENLFEELRWFCWKYSSLDCLPSSFQAPKLIFLDMQHSKVKILWEGTKQLQSLKILNASDSYLLITTPDFKGLESLEKLVLRKCSSLSWIHSSIGLLHKLVHLDLNGCKSLNQLPKQLGNMGCLRKLDASRSSIEQLPDSIGLLGKLEELDLIYCENLRNLPCSICNLTSLTYLGLGSCSNLESLPKNFGNLTSLTYLDLHSCSNLESLPKNFGNLTSLTYLDLHSCSNLESLPKNFGNLTSLTYLYLISCSNLESLPKNFGNLTSLTSLDLRSCSNLESLPKNFGNLTSLTYLYLISCSNLESLPKNFGNLTSLTELDLCNCSNLESLPKNLGNLTSLTYLVLSETNIMQLPDSIGCLTRLKELDMSCCERLRNTPRSIYNLSSLETLRLCDCSNDGDNLYGIESLSLLKVLSLTNEYFNSLPSNLSQLVNLEELDVSRCSSLQSLPELPPNLRELFAHGCTSLNKLPNLSRMNNLKTLGFSKCSSLQSLPKLPPNLRRIDFDACRSLQSLSKLPPVLGKLYLTNCSSLESLSELPPVLKRLYLNNCSSLESLPELPPDLYELDLSNCNKLLSLPKLPPNLEDLRLINCTSLRSLPKLPCKLEYLDLTGCSNLRSLPKFHSNLGYIDLSECRSLESLQELPCHLYSLNASGCKSLQKLPDLSNLTNPRRLILTDCSNLKSNFIWSFLQDCSGLNGCDIYLPSWVIQDRFRHQRTRSSTSFHMPQNVKSNFLRMALWVIFRGKLHSQIEVIITNKTNGTQFKYWGYVQTTGVHAWVRSIGKPISMKSGDKIEVSFTKTEDVTVEMCGVHLDCKRVRDVDVEELLCRFKRLKLSA